MPTRAKGKARKRARRERRSAPNGEKPRLLLLSESLPVARKDGGNLRVYHMLRYLGGRYRVTLVGFTRRKEELASLASLRQHCEKVYGFHLSPLRLLWNCLWGLLSLEPMNVRAYRHGGVRRLLRRLAAREFDLLYAYRLRMAPYLVDWPAKKILDLTDCLSEYYRQRLEWAGPAAKLYWWPEYMKMRRYEPRMAGRFSLSLVVTAMEKAWLNRVANLRVLGNGVELGAWQPGVEGSRRQGLVFLGTMDYPPNVDAVRHFARRLLPAIRRELPGVTFTVVGRGAARSLRRLERQGVTFSGEVEDTGPYLAAAKVFVNPLRFGVGLQNKVLQAMAGGVPVVSTPFSARALGAADGHQLLVGHDDDDFVAKVVKLYRTPGLAERLAASGRRFVENSFRWESRFKALEEMCRSMRP